MKYKQWVVCVRNIQAIIKKTLTYVLCHLALIIIFIILANDEFISASQVFVPETFSSLKLVDIYIYLSTSVTKFRLLLCYRSPCHSEYNPDVIINTTKLCECNQSLYPIKTLRVEPASKPWCSFVGIKCCFWGQQTETRQLILLAGTLVGDTFWNSFSVSNLISDVN